MTTTLEKAPPQAQYFITSGISWSQLEAIEAAFDNVPGIRFIYLDLSVLKRYITYHDQYDGVREFIEELRLRQQNLF